MQHNLGSKDVNATKPSLMSKPSLDAKLSGGTQEPSILSNALGAKSATASASASAISAPKSSKFTLFAVSALALGAAYFGYQYMVASQKPDKSYAKATAVVDEKANEASKSALASTALPNSGKDTVLSKDTAPVAVVAPEAAAQIINEPAPIKPVAPTAESKITTALENGVKPPPAALEKALVYPAPSKAADQSAAPSAAAKTSPGKPAATSSAAKLAEATANNKPASTVATPDKDVSLIAALLNHGVGPAPKAKADSAPSVSTASAATVTAEPTSANVSATASAPAEATTAALKQCGELGFLEREICRVRTCNNQWETNAECKAMMPAASAKP
jgi:hypothetical protein